MRTNNFIQYTTIIILVSILTVLAQFTLLYFLTDGRVALCIEGAIVLLVTLILLLNSYHFEAVFVYMLLNVVLSSVIASYQFIEISYFYYSVTDYKLWTIVVNFLIPYVLCLIVSLFDRSERFKVYATFVRNSSILFSIYYAAIFLYLQFTPHTDTIWSGTSQNLIPFYTIAGYIEDYIYHVGDLKTIFLHLLVPVLLYIPFGFLMGLLLHHRKKFLRFLPIVLLPLCVEVIQFFTHSNNVNIDDFIYGLLGGILGQLIFFLLNALFLGIKGREFPDDVPSYYSTLHF